LLLDDQLLHLLALEVLVQVALEQVPSQLLRVVSELVIAFLDFAHQR
jgi:predicted Zn-dependent protease with MMP-like domain